MFVGSNLTNIRILHGYSRKQLADLLSVTEQSVWQYENGYTSPKLEVVNHLKKIFHVKSKYFYTPDLLTQVGKSNIHHGHIAYRAETINSIQRTHAEAKHVEFLDSFLSKIEENLHYPKNEIRELRESVIQYLINNEVDQHTKIQHVANMAREFLGLPSNSNDQLLFLLEKKGVFLFEKPTLSDKIDAYSLWSMDERPYIILGSIKKSAARRNFDLAHELGHLLLHFKVEFSSLDTKSYREYEKEANLFAGSFLMPEAEFKQHFELLGKKTNPDAYLDLKKKWGVSMQAIAYRAFYLHLMSYQQYRYFNMKLKQKGYKKEEPLDAVIQIVRPGKVRSILQLLFERNYLPLETLMDELKVDEEFIANLTGLDLSFFQRYQTNTSKQFTVNDLNVVAQRR